MRRDLAPRKLFLVSCVAKKRPALSLAKDLYVSPWFIKARAYVESTGAPWFILSAKHGLVGPDARIRPYEVTLNKMNRPERKKWAGRVLGQLGPRIRSVDYVVILAGNRYREFLVPPLKKLGPKIEIPLLHLRIGEQLRWFTGHHGV